jgi:hypothetical protein
VPGRWRTTTAPATVTPRLVAMGARSAPWAPAEAAGLQGDSPRAQPRGARPRKARPNFPSKEAILVAILDRAPAPPHAREQRSCRLRAKPTFALAYPSNLRETRMLTGVVPSLNRGGLRQDRDAERVVARTPPVAEEPIEDAG